MSGGYMKSVDAVTRDIAGETLLVPIRGHLADLRHIFSLNPVGSFVWDRLDGEHDAEALGSAVTAAFDVEPGRAQADVRSFLGQLVEAGLASAGEGGP